MAAQLYFLLAILALVKAYDVSYLFFTHSGGQNDLPGLYRGQLQGDLRKELHSCFRGRDFLNATSFSFDQTTKSLAAMFEESRRVVLVRGDLCRFKAPSYCSPETLINSTMQASERVGPIALLGKEVYMVTRRCLSDQFYLEIRKLGDWPECRFPITNFDLQQCTERTVLIIARGGCASSMEYYVPLNNLVVLGNGRGGLIFLLQMVINEATIDLTLVQNGNKTTAFETAIPFRPSTAQLRQSGAISLHGDDFMCWSDLVDLRCARRVPGNALVGVMKIANESVIRQICGDLKDADLQKVVTGVAIVRRDPLEVYFGCHANVFGEGGAGRITRKDNRTVVERLTDTRGQIRAGHMFVAECRPEVSTGHPIMYAGYYNQVLLSLVSVSCYLLPKLV